MTYILWSKKLGVYNKWMYLFSPNRISSHSSNRVVFHWYESILKLHSPPSNLLQTGDAKEDSEKFVGCREENCVITIRNVKHLLGWVSGDDEVLFGSEDSQVFPCPNVIAVHLSELGRSEWQNLRARTIRSWCHHYSRQIHILQQSQQHSKPYLN